MPQHGAPRPTPRTALIAEAVGGFIYAGQGASGLPDAPDQGRFDRYDPTTDTWAPLPMTSEIYGRASVVLAGKVYAFGGVEHGWPLSKVEAFDPSTNSWSARASMPTTRTGPAAAVVNGLAYVLGGSFTFGNTVGTTANEAYDPNTDSWVPRAPMPRPRICHSAVALAGKIYVFGGFSADTIFDVIDVYDPGRDSWTTLPTRMPRPRAGAAAVLLNDRILLIGGCNNTDGCLAAVEEYDPALDHWATREPMLTRRGALAATVSNGIVYAIGGECGPGLAVVEVYNPALDPSMDSTSPLITPTLTGTVGNNNWYRSAVSVTWSVTDPESGIASSTGCGPTTLPNDTPGTTLTCSAVNGVGLSNSLPITIKIDKTPPTISGMPAPGCTLWPPNHKLVQVATVTASDALSQPVPGSLLVTGTSNEPENGLGDGDTAPDIVVTGGIVQLRAERSGAGAGRIYTLTARAADLAGNAASVTATCTAPKDRGN